MAEKGEVMDVGKDDITIIGFIFTWLAGIFGYGKIYGGLVNKITSHEKRLDTIQKTFFTSDGEPRLMSYAAHDQISNACQKFMYDKLDNNVKRLDLHDEKLDKVIAGINELRVLIQAHAIENQGPGFGRRQNDS
jgi:hypothetical protein